MMIVIPEMYHLISTCLCVRIGKK